jgi:probable F420-dependent oxidoreductase
VFRVYATIDAKTSPAQAGALATRAEAAGFDGLLVADGQHDGLLNAAMALNATRRLTVTVGVLVAFPRSPMTVAHAAWDLQQLSGGRFELGLGPQVRGNIVDRYSTPWTAPAPRMREYLRSLRAIFESFQHGTALRYEGEHYRFTRLQPFFNPGPIEHPEIPILLGAVGPKMTALAGELADGLITHPTNTHPRYVREVTQPRIERGAARSGRPPGAVELVLAPLVATGAGAEELRADRERQRQLLAFLYSTPAYWPSLELFGWGDLGRRLREHTRAGRWSEMARLISDEVLAEMLPSGTHDEIADVLRARYSGVARSITFPLPRDPGDDLAVARVIERMHA